MQLIASHWIAQPNVTLCFSLRSFSSLFLLTLSYCYIEKLGKKRKPTTTTTRNKASIISLLLCHLSIHTRCHPFPSRTSIPSDHSVSVRAFRPRSNRLNLRHLISTNVRAMVVFKSTIIRTINDYISNMFTTISSWWCSTISTPTRFSHVPTQAKWFSGPVIIRNASSNSKLESIMFITDAGHVMEQRSISVQDSTVSLALAGRKITSCFFSRDNLLPCLWRHSSFIDGKLATTLGKTTHEPRDDSHQSDQWSSSDDQHRWEHWNIQYVRRRLDWLWVRCLYRNASTSVRCSSTTSRTRAYSPVESSRWTSTRWFETRTREGESNVSLWYYRNLRG